MNLGLVSELTDYFEAGARVVLVHGNATSEIMDAACQQGLTVRFISPNEFSLPAIRAVQRENLLANRDNPASVGFWTGLRKALRISDSVQVLVFQDINELDDEHRTALESIVKGNMDGPEEGRGFDYVWARIGSSALRDPRLAQLLMEMRICPSQNG